MNILLISVFLLTFYFFEYIFWYYKIFKTTNFFIILIKWIYIIITIILFILFYNSLIGNYHIITIYKISHLNQILFFKLFAIWSNYNSSLFIWLWFLLFHNYYLTKKIQNIFWFKGNSPSFLFFDKNEKLPTKLLNINFNLFFLILFISYMLINNFFLFYNFFTSNPFLFFDSFKLNGIELNPILQDILLAIHPLILYFGYTSLFMIFSLNLTIWFFFHLFIIQIIYFSFKYRKKINIISFKTIKILIKRYTKEYIRLHLKIINNIILFYKQLTKQQLLLCWFFLTFGIFLGSFWAFTTLGWNGFWFFDAVENVSLLAWLLITICLHLSFYFLPKHFFKYSSNIDRFQKQIYPKLMFSTMFGIFTFLSSIGGVFLVRLGLFNSVHTFIISAGRAHLLLYFYIILLIIFIIILIITIFISNNIIKNNNDISLVPSRRDSF
jgi:cytochrome c-type biogenesis protein CcmF